MTDGYLEGGIIQFNLTQVLSGFDTHQYQDCIGSLQNKNRPISKMNHLIKLKFLGSVAIKD